MASDDKQHQEEKKYVDGGTSDGGENIINDHISGKKIIMMITLIFRFSFISLGTTRDSKYLFSDYPYLGISVFITIETFYETRKDLRDT